VFPTRKIHGISTLDNCNCNAVHFILRFTLRILLSISFISTQGIDISDKWVNLRTFSELNGGKYPLTATSAPDSSAENIHVGFVDAEGQGDKDISYDANLVCPILLTSKCVIFNWKGDLQKVFVLIYI
jgi:hypothetical protein